MLLSFASQLSIGKSKWAVALKYLIELGYMAQRLFAQRLFAQRLLVYIVTIEAFGNI